MVMKEEGVFFFNLTERSWSEDQLLLRQHQITALPWYAIWEDRLFLTDLYLTMTATVNRTFRYFVRPRTNGISSKARTLRSSKKSLPSPVILPRLPITTATAK